MPRNLSSNNSFFAAFMRLVRVGSRRCLVTYCFYTFTNGSSRPSLYIVLFEVVGTIEAFDTKLRIKFWFRLVLRTPHRSSWNHENSVILEVMVLRFEFEKFHGGVGVCYFQFISKVDVDWCCILQNQLDLLHMQCLWLPI